MDKEIIKFNFDLMNKIVAIDGFSSTGKSSISKIIAKKLKLIHIDTGAMYRAVTLFALRNFVDENDTINISDLVKNLEKIRLDFKEVEGELQIYLNDENVNGLIRDIRVSNNVSLVAKNSKVREYLVSLQRKISEEKGVVMDGRDIGSVVFPHADYKFFLTASVDERARRRTLELESMGMRVDFDVVKQNLIDRDKMDSEREISPLKMTDDAILIDNTNLDKEQTVDLILSYIKK